MNIYKHSTDYYVSSDKLLQKMSVGSKVNPLKRLKPFSLSKSHHRIDPYGGMQMYHITPFASKNSAKIFFHS